MTIRKITELETLPLRVVVRKPIDKHIKLLFNHIGRYVIATRKLRINKKDVVIDASCGEGYGTFYLSSISKRAYGLDINFENIERAKEMFKQDNLKYMKYFDFMKGKGKADKLICIETLEHMTKDKQEIFVKRLVYMLKVNGSMFLTIPIGQNKPSSYNPFHKNEPSIDVVYAMFKPYFKKINIEISTFVNSYNQLSEFALITLLEKKGVKE